MSGSDSGSVSGNRLFVWIWFWLLFLTAVEVVLAYQHLALLMMIIILLGLSVMKSALIMAYFMHLKFERLSLVFTVVPAVVFMLCMMFISFPDSIRIHLLAPR
jgi:cytochrome c oxidase subunit IV